MERGIQRYLQVYEYYKKIIEDGQLEPDTKLPSIRKAADQFQVSRTTMESAYMLLAAEGYIVSKPQSGYYVTDMAKKKKERMERRFPEKKEKQEIKYDFVTANVDKESFKFDLWSRYMKSALRQSEALLSYGEPQGEEEFRKVLAEYLRVNRSVVCTPEQIVIGAGVQSLLHILCPMIKKNKKAAFHNPDFVQGRAVFEDYGFEIVEKGSGEAVYYISPARSDNIHGALSTNERLELIKKASEKECFIIEDDYNSEFQYAQKPVPSIQGLAGGHGVIYLGTFSKMLLPSIRMSFMVLPLELLESYEARKYFYNQTASKAEQIAITQFIRDGHLMNQIRKSRKIHMAKSEKLLQAAKNVFGREAELQIEETGFRVLMEIKSDLSADEIEKRAKDRGTWVNVVPCGLGGVRMGLICTNIAVENYENAMLELKKCVK